MKLVIIKQLVAIVLLLSWLGSPTHASLSPLEGVSSDLSIVVSIKPVAMLVKAVVGEEIQVQVLLPDSVSPHEYALKFSDLRLVKQADLVVWVGPELEGVLVKALKTISLKNQLQLTQIDTMQWPGQPPGEAHHGHGHHHGGYSKHDDSQLIYEDPHLWLNPKNSIRVVQAVAVALTNKYPEHRALFAKNASRFSESVEDLDNAIQQKLHRVKESGFVVTHDGYRHFVDYYDLNQLSAIQLASGANRGVRHYGEILALGDQVACVFTEPQLNSKTAMQLASKLGVNQEELDLMGRKILLSRESYLEFFRAFADTFVECLGNK